MAKRSVAGVPTGFTKIGNVPELTIDIEVTKFEHKESESGSRLIDVVIIQEKKGTFNFVAESLSLENLSVGLWGESAVVASGTVSGGSEVITIPTATPAGAIFPLAHPRVTSVVVTGSGGTPSYAEGTDYDVDAVNGAITVKGAIVTDAASSDITIEPAYSYAGYTKMDAFTQATAPERWLRFHGLNTINNDAVIIDMFRAQFDPLTGYGLINEELGSVTMQGTLLADDLRVTGSKFFQERISAAA